LTRSWRGRKASPLRVRDRSGVLVATPPPPGPGSPCRAAPPEARHHAAACPRAAGHRQASHWSPEEFLRTLLEAEIASGDLSNATARMKAAAFRVRNTIEGFDVAASSIPQATFDYLASLEWIRAKECRSTATSSGTSPRPWTPSGPTSRPGFGTSSTSPPNADGSASRPTGAMLRERRPR
jgi:hypothetical protein